MGINLPFLRFVADTVRALMDLPDGFLRASATSDVKKPFDASTSQSPKLDSQRQRAPRFHGLTAR